MTAPPRHAATAALTEADLDTFEACMLARTRDVTPRPRAWRETLLGLLVALAAGLAAVALDAVTEAEAFTVVILAFLAYAAGLLAMRAAVLRHLRAANAARRDSTAFLTERRRFDLTEDGIEVRGATARAAWSWRALTDAERWGDLLVFRIGIAHGFAVPVRAFADAAEAEAALAFARARIAAVRSPAAPPAPPAAGT
jgi:hypothetical protein